ncbi:SDR family NAD(P)-dependent oxidoreductase [Pelomonas aquatica]|jgi:short-subunit dehydrogenase|nr:SDR family NAD(P)-dependent oxidoreductase [Pelomonas aquatica]MCY4756584.1 SDR family NAD(P)-dependent oxidoreductase [Pelomonas aquatica]
MTIPSMSDADFRDRYGPWALISGASEGTGAEFALQAAAKGLNVILVARRIDKLNELAERIRAEQKVEVHTVSLDLTAADAAAQLQQAAAGRDLGLVVFNAGGDSVGGPFLDKPYASWRTLTQRNIDLLTEACHAFGTAFAKRGRGGLILVGSEAALGGCGRLAIYTATKAYAMNFGESLWKELKPHGVDVLNLLIGATDTPKLRTVFAKNNLSPDLVPLTPSQEVARLGLSGLGRGPTLVLNALEDLDSPLVSSTIRRERVEVQSKFLDNFYGPA